MCERAKRDWAEGGEMWKQMMKKRKEEEEEWVKMKNKAELDRAVEEMKAPEHIKEKERVDEMYGRPAREEAAKRKMIEEEKKEKWKREKWEIGQPYGRADERFYEDGEGGGKEKEKEEEEDMSPWQIWLTELWAEYDEPIR